jgi:hypothetical protein
MAFSEATKAQAYARAGGRCECTMSVCSDRRAGVRCNKSLSGEWHAHHKTSLDAHGTDDLGNCLAMCIPCHKNTRTYGRS